MSVGVPLLATAYITGFATAGIAILAGSSITHGQAWVTAIPLFGTAILGAITQGALSGLAVLTIVQGVGTALIIAAAVMPLKYPYDDDPTALRLGRTKHGHHALELRLLPSATGGALVGRF